MADDQSSPTLAPTPGIMPCYWTPHAPLDLYGMHGMTEGVLRWSLDEQWIELRQNEDQELVFRTTFQELNFVQETDWNTEFVIQGKHYNVTPGGFKKSWSNTLSGNVVIVQVNDQKRQTANAAQFNDLIAALKAAGKYRSSFRPRQLIVAVLIGFFGTIAAIVIIGLIVAHFHH